MAESVSQPVELDLVRTNVRIKNNASYYDLISPCVVKKGENHANLLK